MSSIYESAEMIGAFLDEVEEQLQLLDESILELEQSGETTEVIQKIFRVAHTLKGSSSTMGFKKMKDLTHEMENVLDKIRNNQLKATRSVVNILFQCADYLRLLKNDYASNKTEIKTEINTILLALKQVLSKEGQETEPLRKEDNDEAEHTGMQSIFSPDQEKVMRMEEACKNGKHNLVCTVRILESSPMKSTRACLILNYFNELGTVVDTYPNVLELTDENDVNEISYLVISEVDSNTLRTKALVEIMDIESIIINPFLFSSKEVSLTLKEQQSSSNSLTINIPKVSEADKKVAQTVRVDVERLEKMMNLVGELVIEQTRIAQVGNALHNRYASDNAVEDLMSISNHVSRVIGELQEGVMKTRMLPIQQLFNRFPRMVRDLSQTLDKEIELVLSGGETEMDRTIIEEINDPLIHIIRNSVDHGIETMEERIRNGKPSKGTIKMTAYHQENHVIMTIEDDGAGIDRMKLKASAVRKRLITQQEADNLSDQQALNLIFETGFSTASVVSDVSGRGVGMDIVRSHIDKLNGIIEVDTKIGQGTKFIIKLPLTLAILTGLLVKINRDTFALPMSNVIEIVRKPSEEIEAVKGQTVAVIRERVLPLIWIHDYFGIPRNNQGKNVFIVVLGVAEKRIGLVVDELIGNQEIVVKPLGAYIGKVEGFSGATILGDGSVACILDIGGIAKMVSSRKVSEISDHE